MPTPQHTEGLMTLGTEINVLLEQQRAHVASLDGGDFGEDHFFAPDDVGVDHA